MNRREFEAALRRLVERAGRPPRPRGPVVKKKLSDGSQDRPRPRDLDSYRLEVEARRAEIRALRDRLEAAEAVCELVGGGAYQKGLGRRVADALARWRRTSLWYHCRWLPSARRK